MAACCRGLRTIPCSCGTSRLAQYSKQYPKKTPRDCAQTGWRLGRNHIPPLWCNAASLAGKRSVLLASPPNFRMLVMPLSGTLMFLLPLAIFCLMAHLFSFLAVATYEFSTLSLHDALPI